MNTTSQPGVSKQIRLLEEELGVEIFVRHGKRLVAITEPGGRCWRSPSACILDVDNLRQVGAEFSNEASGSLSIATTHTQARYALPPVIQAFVTRYPNVRLSLHQGSPRQVCEYVLSGEADIAIATEAIAEEGSLVMLPCYQWNRCVIAPQGHPILSSSRHPGGHRPLSAHHLRLCLHRAQPDQQGLPGRGPEAQRGAHGHRLGHHQDLRGDGAGHGHPGADGLRPGGRPRAGMVDAAHLFESSTTRIGVRRNALAARLRVCLHRALRAAPESAGRGCSAGQ